MKNKILFISRKAPYGTSTAKEALDALLAASAYDQDLSLLFLGDGIFQLKKDQQLDNTRQKNISNIFPVLEMYDIENIFVQASALKERGLSENDLAIKTKALDDTAIATLMAQQKTLLSF